MKIDFPYDYITLYAYMLLLQYEKKREINIDTLKKYYNYIYNIVINNYQQEKANNCIISFYDEVDDESNLIFIKENNDKYIFYLLVYYQNYFHLQGNKLCLNDNISFNDIEALISFMETKRNYLVRFLKEIETDEVKAILGIKKIKKVLNQYLKLETLIENAYQNNYLNLNKLLMLKELFFKQLMNINPETLDAYIDTAQVFYEDILPYSKKPINFKLWKDTYYQNIEQKEESTIKGELEENFNNIMQYALFNKESLAKLKVINIFNNIYEEDDEEELDDTDYFDNLDKDTDTQSNSYIFISDDEYTFNIFFVIYLYKLNKYIKDHPTLNYLNDIKNRLLYALDNPSDLLYKEENLDELYNLIISANNLEYLDLGFLEREALYFTEEVFKFNDDNTLIKLLFIATYYEITHDEEVINILNKYKDTIEYPFYKNIILGSSLGRKRELN